MTTPATPPTNPATPSQDELKAQVGRAALAYVVPGQIVGVGTGSTVNKFIDALADIKDDIEAGNFPYSLRFARISGRFGESAHDVLIQVG